MIPLCMLVKPSVQLHIVTVIMDGYSQEEVRAKTSAKVPLQCLTGDSRFKEFSRDLSISDYIKGDEYMSGAAPIDNVVLN